MRVRRRNQMFTARQGCLCSPKSCIGTGPMLRDTRRSILALTSSGMPAGISAQASVPGLSDLRRARPASCTPPGRA